VLGIVAMIALAFGLTFAGVAWFERGKRHPRPCDGPLRTQGAVMIAKAAVVEIVERGKSVDDSKPNDGVIVPNDIRINGQSILCEAGSVRVHEMDLAGHDTVRVTLTLFARRVVIGAEGDI
jgi:hypothetical protein